MERKSREPREPREPKEPRERLDTFQRNMQMGELAHEQIFPGILMVPRFAQKVLSIDPAAMLEQLQAKYPVCGEEDTIVRNVVQWVDGDNVALKYRGRVLRRCKMWLQRGATASVGYRRYRYTGWQWKVLPATVDVAMCPEVSGMATLYDDFCDGGGVPRANHYIVTAYEDGQHSIGWHFDKPDSIDPDSIITVVKLGATGRPFALRRLGETEPFFNQVLEPGTAVIMTMQANLATQHSVPEVPEAGRSGSIVFRTITESYTEDQVAAELAARGVAF